MKKETLPKGLELADMAGAVFNNPIVQPLFCILFPLGVFSLILLAEGKSVIDAYNTILGAIFRNRYGRGEVVVRATYLILTSMTAILPGRVGLANAGGEGQMAIGALFTAFAGSMVIKTLAGPLGIPILLVSGMAAGAIWAGIGIFFFMKLGMNETLTTILMNYISIYFIQMLLFGPLRDPHGWNYPQTPEIARQFRLSSWFGTRMNVGIVISVITAVLVWYVLHHTKAGFTVRTIGGSQMAARYAGINVKKVQTLVFLIAGALAGLAGAILILGTEGRMRVDAGATMGFMGFLTAGMVKNNPILAVPSAFMLGALIVSGNAMEINTGLPAASMQILIMLFLLTIMALGKRAKKS
jgi:simple sugar transport system permease protein